MVVKKYRISASGDVTEFIGAVPEADDVPDAMSKAMRIQLLPRNRFERLLRQFWLPFHLPSFLMGLTWGAAFAFILWRLL